MNTRHGLSLCLLLAALALTSCATAPGFSIRTAKEVDISGTYDVISYGCSYLNDPETIAFLDKTGDPYTFEPFAPEFKYHVRKGLAAPEALAIAKKLVDCSPSFSDAEILSIVGPSGDVLGYEVRPRYRAFAFGTRNILQTNYWIKNSKLMIMIRLETSVDRSLQDNGIGIRSWY